MSADLSSLTQLTADVSAAMHAAERPAPARRRRRWHPWILAAGILGLAVPSALAVRSLISTDRTVDIPVMRRGLGHGYGLPSAGATVIAAQGTVQGHPYTLLAQRCDYKGNVTLGTGFVLGKPTVYSGGGFSPCAKRDQKQPLISSGSSWSAGQSWIFGYTRANVASVDLELVRRVRRPNGTRRSFDPSRVTVPTRRIDQAATHQGNLPPGYRTFVLFRPTRTEALGLTARDSTGTVIARCKLAGACQPTSP